MLSTLPKPPQRLEICPPERGAGLPWWRRLHAWASAGWPGLCRPAPESDPLAAIRREFADVMGDLNGERADLLIDHLHRARSLRELWHLRAEVFRLVSLQHSQHEADTRLAQLNRHFPTRSPRSGFGTLEPRDMWP